MNIKDISKQRNKEIARLHNVLLNDVKQAWKEKATRRLIWAILGECGLYEDNVQGDKYLEGRRSLGLSIISLIEEASPLAYAKLIIEMDKEKNND